MLFIFDMGGVVTSTFQMDAIYKKMGINKDTFFKICKSNKKDIWKELETGKIDTNCFWQQFNENILNFQNQQTENETVYKNIPIIENDLFRLFFHPVLNQKTVELISELKKKHRVVCGTNTIQSHWENHLERGDYTFFDQTYASNKIGIAKPDPKFFELIMEAENAEPENTFFTDDKEENCKAAASLGISTFLCKSPKDLFNEWIKFKD